jgi:acetyltransferase-like isoleucine patch superfamily enzyme
MLELLKVPYLGTAEEDVLVAAWMVGEGQGFQRGEVLASVETLKAAFEVEAERDGVLVRRLAEVGERIAMHAALGLVADPGETPTAAEIDAIAATAAAAAAPPTGRSQPVDAVPATAPQSTPSAAGGEPDAAPAARARARELGLDLRGIRGSGPGGLIRVTDVEAAAARPEGLVDPDFVARLRGEAAAFGALSSELKVAIYRRMGASIAEDVTIGPGAWIRASRIVLGPGSRLGAETTIEAESFVAGRLAQFGPRCKLRCRKITLGDNAFFAADVEVGGGGATEPEAELRVGNNGFVGEHAHLNPCRLLEIGDEVVVSRSAVVMTHSFGGSLLQGYPNRFAPVRIGDRCQVGIHAMLFPGVEMGAGSILLSNSTLVTSIPPGRMFAGVPATDLRAAAHPPDPGQLEALVADLCREFARQLRLRGREVELEDRPQGLALTVQADGGAHRLWFGAEPPGGTDLPREDVWVATAVDAEQFDAAPPELAVFDLGTPRVRGSHGPLADAFREFLRKRGVRTGAWTYPGGWL